MQHAGTKYLGHLNLHEYDFFVTYYFELRDAIEFSFRGSQPIGK